MKKAIVFAGGGARGAAGARQALRLYSAGDRWILFSGESIGAVNAFGLAILGAVELCRVWSQDLGPDDIYRGGSWIDKLATLLGRRRGIYDMSPSLETLRQIALTRRIPEGQMVISTVCDLQTGARIDNLLTSETPTGSCVEKVFESTLVPLAHGARAGRWADGGISSTAPLAPVIRQGAEAIDVILLAPLTLDRWLPHGSAIDEAGRAVDILRRNLFYSDLELAALVNREPGPGKRFIPITIWIPIDSLAPWMDFSREAILQNMEARFRPATLEEAVQEIKAARLQALQESLSGIPAKP